MQSHGALLECSILYFLMLCVSSQNYTSTLQNEYEELKQLNASCYPMVSCKESRNSDDIMANGCSCSSYCSKLGICCVDSIYRNQAAPKQKPTCRPVYHSNPYLRTKFHIIDQCPLSSTMRTAQKSLCNDERDGEDDLMRNIPVTSLFTQITYKNYFCFRCHEANDDYLYWNVRIKSVGEIEQTVIEVDHDKVNVTYDREHKTWMAQSGEGDDFHSFQVSLNVEIPDEINPIAKSCYSNVISDCADSWTEDEIRNKCKSYTSHITIFSELGRYPSYKNPHCALCNFENLANKFCAPSGEGKSGVPTKQTFSFSMLMDINRSDGDRVGKIKLCDDDDDVWDPFFKKCRSPVCAIPGHVIKNGACGPP